MKEYVYTGLPLDYTDTENWEPIPKDIDEIMAEVARQGGSNWRDLFKDRLNNTKIDSEHPPFY